MRPVRTVWFYPYVVKNNKLKPNLRLNAKKFNTGIYLIKDLKTNKILYVGYSGSNLYKTMYRHFQNWSSSKQYRAVFKKSGVKIRIIFTSPKKAQSLEKYLIRKYKEKGEAVYNQFQYETEAEIKPQIYENWDEEIKDIITARPNEDENDIPF